MSDRLGETLYPIKAKRREWDNRQQPLAKVRTVIRLYKHCTAGRITSISQVFLEPQTLPRLTYKIAIYGHFIKIAIYCLLIKIAIYGNLFKIAIYGHLDV